MACFSCAGSTSPRPRPHLRPPSTNPFSAPPTGMITIDNGIHRHPSPRSLHSPPTLRHQQRPTLHSHSYSTSTFASTDALLCVHPSIPFILSQPLLHSPSPEDFNLFPLLTTWTTTMSLCSSSTCLSALSVLQGGPVCGAEWSTR